MKNILKISIILLITQMMSAQKVNKKNQEFIIDIRETTKLKHLENRHGITFYLGKDKRTILALQNDKIKWISNIVAVCGKPKVGKPLIRNTQIKSGKLQVIFGKHNFAEIDLESGKEVCLGAD